MKKLQEVYRAKDPEQSGLVVAMLKQEGIDAKADGAILGSAVGDIPMGWSTSPRIMVSVDDYERAREIVVEWDAKNLERANETQPTKSLAMWTCPECSEEVEYNFEMCWNCQYNRTAC